MQFVFSHFYSDLCQSSCFKNCLDIPKINFDLDFNAQNVPLRASGFFVLSPLPVIKFSKEDSGNPLHTCVKIFVVAISKTMFFLEQGY